MSKPTVLEVLLHRQPVGTLTLFPSDRTLFAFNEAYIQNAARPTLSLSFKDELGELITDLAPAQTRLPPFFSNLLPEGALRSYLAERARVNPKREFFLILALGRDLPGALAIRPIDGDEWPPDDSDDISAASRAPTGRSALRFSLAGVQLKLSAVMGATGGLTIPAEGVGGSWIVKLPSFQFAGVPENEYAMMTLARRIGLDVPDVQLVRLADIEGLPEDMGQHQQKGHALAVRRFDRSDGAGIHIEDFAQVFGVYPEEKYKRASYRNLAEVIWAEVGEPGITEFIRRLVFSVLIGNADMHLKNWSLIYPDGRRAALAPGYDFVSTLAYINDPNMALTLGKSKKMTDVSFASLRYLAAKARLPEKAVLDAARDTTERFLDVWGSQRGDLPIDRAVVETIERHLTTIPLVAAAAKAWT